MYYEDDSSCSEESYTPNQLEKVIQESMNTTERRNVRYQRKSRKGKQNEVNKEEENAEKRKKKKKLKEGVDFEVFQDERKLLSEEEQHLGEKGNCFEDENLFCSNS